MASPDRHPGLTHLTIAQLYNCGVCTNDLVKNHKVALLCDACNTWYCHKCMGVSEAIFKAFSKENADISMITDVACRSCIKAKLARSR